ncbi:DegT/DnrJ/EryC1/StrS family aminotransferase [Meridianimarinicoccus aquatilis]|uniref:Aminotransferase n=1 Tax=Meridianimarinicoccus aquatilis TaxID=2552766 RepID=A0A4R6B5N7_9RHOB|nr:DegT/DnrJ/EryC1/StrS family aminotransferase [Fluviibacterium aquatile]TDL91113.1 aminotransferase [Fluviibacterium aquatile]
MIEMFDGSFTQQTPIPDAAQQAALAVMQSGRLHRYNLAPGDFGEVGALEREFAAYVGARYCLAVASGGQGMQIALRAVGVAPGEMVLTNAFTLAPVPGAIAAVGARPLLVDTADDLTIDLDDLQAKLGHARVLLLSHMRGHVCDMDRLMGLCNAADVTVIEDCAHTMGAVWRGVPSGRHGIVGCYSTQTYKHMNSGEGGIIVTDDADVIARATVLSGSYMLHQRHPAGPGPEAFEDAMWDMPNMSARMDHLRGAILRPQLAQLDERCAAWTARYRVVESHLQGAQCARLIPRAPHERFVGSSIQFVMDPADPDLVTDFVGRCGARGVELKWFGADRPVAFTSRYDHWHFAAPSVLPGTDRLLSGLLDMRLPLTFSLDDCALIGRILREELERTTAGQKVTPAAE